MSLAAPGWDLALWAACAATIAAMLTCAWDRWRPWLDAARAQRILLAAAAAIAVAAFLWLLSRFLLADVSVQVVFLYTHRSLPLQWRLAGTWASREGSLLLWTADLAVVTALVAWRHGRRPSLDADEERGRTWTRLALAAILAAFLAAVAAQHTFAPTPQFFLQGRPDGNGLNPTLKSPFILIHPPVMFAAYGLATVPAAAALGHLASGSNRWGRIAMGWSRVDWLLYTFAMGLGGLWAYYTLGFGGYWAWDPVEVANLLPWLGLTVYLHAQLQHARHGTWRDAGPFLGPLPFLLTLFSTISTRSGLWVSVHAFTDPTNTFDPDAPARFLDILGVERGLLVYVRLFLATLCVGLALWCLRLAKDHRTLPRAAPAIAAVLAAFGALSAIAPRLALQLLFEAAWRGTGGHAGLGLLGLLFAAAVAAALPALAAKDESEARRPLRVDLRTLAAYSIVVLGLTLLVLFLLHAAAANGWSTRFYEERVPALATAGMLGLLVLFAHSVVGRRNSLWLAAGVWAAAGLAALAVRGHREGAYLLVFGCALLVVGIWRVRDAAVASGLDKRARLAPTLLLVAGLADLAFWMSPPRMAVAGWSWQPAFPAQLVFGAAAAVVLWSALRMLAGAAPPRPGWAFALAALLVGYAAAPVLALAGWLSLRKAPLAPAGLDRRSWAKLKQAALYGAHLAIAVAIVGYAPSTYWKEKATMDLGIGEAAHVGPATFRLVAVDVRPDGPYAQTFAPRFERAGGGSLVPTLGWEGQVGAHFPLPATLRLWSGDLYLNLDAVHVAASACSDARTIQAYQAANPPRACAGDTVDGVTVDATWLPGVGLMWTALALLLLAMALLMRAESASAPPAQAGTGAGADVADPAA